MKGMEERLQKATEDHKKGYNCAQCVLCAYADVLNMEESVLFRVAEGFGGGMGGMMGTCGAVTAMFMAAGLKNSCGDLHVCNSKMGTNKLVRSMAEKFQQQNQSLICRELKGVDTGKVLRSCPDCIADAIRIVGEEFGIS